MLTLRKAYQCYERWTSESMEAHGKAERRAPRSQNKERRLMLSAPLLFLITLLQPIAPSVAVDVPSALSSSAPTIVSRIYSLNVAKWNIITRKIWAFVISFSRKRNRSRAQMNSRCPFPRIFVRLWVLPLLLVLMVLRAPLLMVQRVLVVTARPC